jgi:hypothetical protein
MDRSVSQPGLDVTTYYSQQWENKGRLIIDSTFPLSAASVKESCEADCWIAAKKAFGFELTATQEYLLDQFKRKRRLP